MTTPINAAIEVLTPLLGSWRGQGSGSYPTIAAFHYREEITFGHSGKPFFSYIQRTRAGDDGRPLHTESGYLRLGSPGVAEFTVAHPTGLTEIYEGPWAIDAGVLSLELTATLIGRTSTAKQVTVTERAIRLDGDTLHYTMRMAAVGQPLQHHLEATLQRNPS